MSHDPICQDNLCILGKYFVIEIEYLILEFLDPIKDYKNLVLVNKYYNDLVQQDQTFIQKF